MLTELKVGTNSGERIQEDAVTLLLACHDRIRHFTEIAERLAQNPGSPARDRQDAAGAVLRYYQVALPLHEADENESIYPRLHEKLPPGYLAAANESMVQQHTAIDALVAELLAARPHSYCSNLRLRSSNLRHHQLRHLLVPGGRIVVEA